MQTNLEAIKLMNSDGFEEKIKESPAPMVAKPQMGLQAKGHDLNQKIINKIFSLSKALSDALGLDQREVMEDIFRDLRLANGEEIINLIKSDSPIDVLSRELAKTAKEDGMDSNKALNFLLTIDEKDFVETFRQMMQRNGGRLSNNAQMRLGNRPPMRRIRGLPQIPENMMENLIKRVTLIETIENKYNKSFSDIPRETFDKLIRLDPTFEETEDELGNFGEWILIRFRKKELKKNELDEVRETLFDFMENRRFIPQAELRDINRHKSLSSIRDALNTVELSRTQIISRARKAKQHADLGEEAEFIGENDKWEIWSPKTYAASCKLGSGATWCTASTSYRGYFDSYTKSGKLYIFLSKGKEEVQKYQAHVKNNVVDQFMDIYNRPSIEFSTFIHQEELLPVLKATELKNVDVIIDVENMGRLSKGEPYMYAGGKVKSSFAPIIKVVRFVEDYNKEEIPGFAFKGCVNMEEIYVPIIVKSIGVRAFEGCEKVTIYTPKHPMKCYPSDLEFLKDRIKYVDKI